MPPTNVKLQKVIDNREKLQALPPEQAELVANRIFDLMVLPKAGKGLQAEQIEMARSRFTNFLLGRSEQGPIEDKPDYSGSGLSTGAGGVFKSGVMHGVANLGTVADKLNMMNPMTIMSNAIQRKLNPNGMDPNDQVTAAINAFRSTGDTLKAPTAQYRKENPVKSAVIETTGEALPAIPLGMGIGAAFAPAAELGPGASVISRILANLPRNMATGATEMQSIKPGAQGAAEGALWGAGTNVITGLGGKLLDKVKGISLVPKSSTALPGASQAIVELNKHAQDLYKRDFGALNGVEKSAVVTKWREAAVEAAKATQAAQSAAKKTSAAQVAQDAVAQAKARAEAQVTAQAEKLRLKDEAKLVSKAIAAFRKAAGRTPTDDEISQLKTAVQAKMKSQAAAPAPAAASVVPEAPTIPKAQPSGNPPELSAMMKEQAGAPAGKTGVFEDGTPQAQIVAEVPPGHPINPGNKPEPIWVVNQGPFTPERAMDSLKESLGRDLTATEQAAAKQVKSWDELGELEEKINPSEKLIDSPFFKQAEAELGGQIEKGGKAEFVDILNRTKELKDAAARQATISKASEFKSESPEATRAVSAIADLASQTSREAQGVLEKSNPIVEKAVAKGKIVAGTRVKINEGEYQGTYGRIVQKGEDRALVRVELSDGRVTEVEMPLSSVEREYTGGSRASEAARKAAARTEAAATQGSGETALVGQGAEGLAAIEKVASSAATPEEHMIALEQAYGWASKNIPNGSVLVKAFKKAAKVQGFDSETTLNLFLDTLEKAVE
jgi:hypothetical protein